VKLILPAPADPAALAILPILFFMGCFIRDSWNADLVDFIRGFSYVEAYVDIQAW